MKHHERTANGFLTKDDFVSLYDKCGKVLHARNPFNTEPIPQSEYTIEEWVSRIATLLRWHFMQLVKGDALIVTIPENGVVHGWSATPK